jgi:LacI family transcriptional regulator
MAMAAARRIGIALEFHLLYKNHTETFAGVERYAQEHGWLTVFDDWIAGHLERSTVVNSRYDGIIARVGPSQLKLVDAAAKAGVPLVNVLADSPARERLPGVFPDHEQIGRLRAEHLLSRGLRHFSCISLKDRQPYRLQMSAFADTIAAAGHAITWLDMSSNWDESSARYQKNQARIHRWMDQWQLPVGFASPSDVIARFMAQMAHERGWRVPEDVAIVGGLNEELICEAPRPTLTSVEAGYERVGYEAARLLDGLMQEADAARAAGKSRRSRKAPATPEKPVHVILPPVGIVVRESTDFYASGDDIVSQAQAFIAAQCHTHLDVSDVAEKVCVSPRTLQYRFASELNRSVAQEIRRVRLEKVKRELTSGDRSIHEIARRAGFASDVRLCETFKREVGVSPAQYRKQRQVRPHP